MSIAGIGPENVMVVVNGDSQDSLRVANAYAYLRKIPASNFVVLHGLSGKEVIDVEKFRKEILSPVIAAIEGRGLAKQIDCISYSVDIPYTVDVTGDIKGRKLSQVITPAAAANGLTYLMDWTQKGDIDYLRLDINSYCRRRTPVPKGAELNATEQIAFGEAMAKYDAKDYKAAIVGLEKLMQTDRTDPNIAYNLACCYALDGDKDAAVAALRKAVSWGWRNHGHVTSDTDLAGLRDREDFQKLVQLMRTAHVTIQPSLPFRRAIGWTRAGEPDTSGAKYMLSTFLGVTAGRGNSVDEIIESLKRSRNADFTAPKGTVYFERNGDVRSTTREWGFQAAAEELRKLGVNAVVEDGVLPKERSDVAGGVIGIADFDWAASKSTILPGAIVEHLTSCGGMIGKGAPQTPCTEFIKHGAAGASGTVTEPYALQEKFPSPFIQVHYAKGFTLAEAFYLSLYGPYQLLVIGDPLCRPWAKRVEVKASGITDGQALTNSVSIKPSVSPLTQIAEYRLYVDGKLVSSSKPGSALTLDPKSLPEGYHEVSIVAERADEAAGQYRTAFQVTVPGVQRAFTVPDKVQASLDGDLVFRASAKGATSIELFHMGRSIGTCGASGTIEVKAAVVGGGTALVYPVATFGSERVYGKPITVTIDK